MKLKKKLVPAHRDYFLTLVRVDGKREPNYLPYAFRSEADAQRMADEKNKHYKHGRLVVEYIDRPASVSYEGTLAL